MAGYNSKYSGKEVEEILDKSKEMTPLVLSDALFMNYSSLTKENIVEYIDIKELLSALKIGRPICLYVSGATSQGFYNSGVEAVRSGAFVTLLISVINPAASLSGKIRAHYDLRISISVSNINTDYPSVNGVYAERIDKTVADDLETNSSTQPLSAAQGKALDDKIAALKDEIEKVKPFVINLNFNGYDVLGGEDDNDDIVEIMGGITAKTLYDTLKNPDKRGLIRLRYVDINNSIVECTPSIILWDYNDESSLYMTVPFVYSDEEGVFLKTFDIRFERGKYSLFHYFNSYRSIQDLPEL